ncbi:BatA domain-containing protein [Cellulophaga sp. Hel_I_12]|uniref:BatA domain-containing protein n=1 Tax=Cellulophaga sp. Hel_I_12 TaxID=1249972 RepID=UPI000645564B|nr:BatA domain-containing protein [Cellulophaga sp. Hel_I_12]
MSFLNPTYLWALLGILIPIAIHLWNRKKIVTIKVGSIAMLTASEPKRTSSIIPNEWWLLLLRILMIALVAFILAGPNFKRTKYKESLTYVIDPELLHVKGMEPLLDSLPSQALRIMVNGFPLLEDYDFETTKSYAPKYWQMAQEMEHLETDSIIVLTKGLVTGIRGMRPTSSKGINWLVVDTDEKTTALIEATVLKDSIALLSITSDLKSLAYTKSNIAKNSEDIKFNTPKDSIQIHGDWVEVKPAQPLKVLIVAEDSLSHDLNYIKAAYRAVEKYLNRPIALTRVPKIDTLALEAYATLIWLSKNKFENYPVPTLVYRPDSLANQLIVNGNTKKTFFLTHRLNSENILTEHLPEKLLELLSLHEGVPEKASTYDQRTIDAKELQSIKVNQKSDRKYAAMYDLSLWVWLVLGILMGLERIVSKYRRQ